MFNEVTLNCLQKQYGYTNLSDLLLKRAAVWDKYMGDISKTFVDEILNIDTCVSSALDYFWGKILKLNRNYIDDNEQEISLTDSQYREVLKIKAFGISWLGDLRSLNTFLESIFKDRGLCIAVDNQDMTINYLFYFQIETWENYLLKEVLPRPAGVGSSIFILGSDFFGFYGSDNKPFNQAPFFTSNQ